MATLPFLPDIAAVHYGIGAHSGHRPPPRLCVQVEIEPYLAELRLAETYFAHPRNFHAAFTEKDLADLQRLSVLVETRDDVTGKHALRVGALSRRFALHAGLPSGAAMAIDLAARLHDIGKVFVPDRILLKPGPLDEGERKIMQQHAAGGAQLMGNSDQPGRLLARVIAHFHHEHWDASGYPYGLPGEQIPYIVRLVSVVDVFDALVNERPYKPAWDIETTLSWMLRQAGRQFDPVLMRQFAEFIEPARQDWPALKQQLEIDEFNLPDPIGIIEA